MDNQPVSPDIIKKYFPDTSADMQQQFNALEQLYNDWNSKINVISRSDTDNLYERHVLHSLAIAKFLGELHPGTDIMDLGTGGGFPGIPLAIMYPQCHFHLVDRIGKKIRVAQDIANAIGLKNISFQHGDSGECRRQFDYVVSRAVMSLPELVKACAKNIMTDSPRCNKYAPGLVCLKGGDLSSELAATPVPAIDVEISDYFSEPFFETKKVVYVQLSNKALKCSK